MSNPSALMADYLDGTIDVSGLRDLAAWLNDSDANADCLARQMMLEAQIRVAPAAARTSILPHSLSSQLDTETRKSLKVSSAAYAIAAVVALTTAAAAIYWVASTRGPSIAEHSGQPVATLIESTGTVSYENSPAYEGSEYASGSYAVESGSAQFLLTSRVTAELEDKALLRVRSPMRVALESGTVSFDCPRDAKGFTVDLPGGLRVVDLGTRFRVSLEQDERGTIEVTKGSVRVEHADPDHDAPIVLRAGERCVVARAGDAPDGAMRIVRVDNAPNLLVDFTFDGGEANPRYASQEVVSGAFESGRGNDPDAAGVSNLTDCAFVRVTASARSESSVLSGTNYLRFVASAREGHRLNLRELAFRLGCSRVRPKPWAHTMIVQSSVGGFGPKAPVLARIDQISSQDIIVNGYSVDFDPPRSIALSDPSFASVESVEFRFYFFSAEPLKAAVHRIDDVRLLGGVVDDPSEPAEVD